MDPKLLLYARGTPFSGVEGDNWDTWIARFEARTSPLSDTEKLHVLLGLLEGQALDVCGALSSKEQTDYNKVKSTLEAQFNTKVDELQAFSAFSQATRQPGESIQAFGDRLKRLAQWTYQKQAETNEQVIQTIVNRFICGIQDPWLQRKLFVDRPKDLETAVKKGQGTAPPAGRNRLTDTRTWFSSSFIRRSSTRTRGSLRKQHAVGEERCE